jgi:hypothetical protein
MGGVYIHRAAAVALRTQALMDFLRLLLDQVLGDLARQDQKTPFLIAVVIAKSQIVLLHPAE